MLRCLHRTVLSVCISSVLYLIRLALVHVVRPVVHNVVDAGNHIADILAIAYTLVVPDLA